MKDSCKYMNTRKLTTIGLFTAILCILGPIALILPYSPVPVSLGTLGVMLACTMLDARNGLLCTTIYLLLGFAGLPVFTGFTGGAGKLLGPTGGYLIGYLFLASIGGFLASKWKSHRFLQAVGLFLGMLICYLFGSLWLIVQSGMALNTVLWVGVIPYIPFDIGKLFVVIVLSPAVRKRIRFLLK